VGRGNFGKVYSAKYKKSLVAVKTVSFMPKKPSSPLSLSPVDNYLIFKEEKSHLYRIEAFFRELYFHASLCVNPATKDRIVPLLGLVTYQDKDLHEEVVGYVMEFAPRSLYASLFLDNLWASGSVADNKIIAKIALDLARALAGMHSLRIIHNDLACRNVLMNEAGVAVLCDFGLTTNDPSPIGLQVPWQIASPAALRGESRTSCDDVWMFGLLLWELYTRSEPWLGQGKDKLTVTEEDVHFLHKTQTKIDVSSPSIPAEIKQVILQCTDYDPKKRPTMEIIVKTLSAFNVAATAQLSVLARAKRNLKKFRIPKKNLNLVPGFEGMEDPKSFYLEPQK